MWKKVIIGILIVVILAGIGVGIYFGVSAKKKNDSAVDGEVFQTLYLQDEYVKGEKIVFKTVSQADKAYTSMKYAIDSGEETALTVKTGETKDNDALDAKDGDYYVDSGVQTLETTDLQVGTHVLTVYVYHDTTRVILFEHILKVTEAA